MNTTADYINALMRDRNDYEKKLNDYGIEVHNLTFTEMNKKIRIPMMEGLSFAWAKEKTLDYETSILDTSGIENFSSVFYRCNNITSLNLSHWNMSSAKNLGGMFYWCVNLVSVDVSNWDVSNVTSMKHMFYQCDNLSNQSVQNICNMCINAVNMPVKNLHPSNFESPLIYTEKYIENIVDAETLNKLRLGGWTW